MPRLMDKDLANMTSIKTASNFQFSAVKLDELGASEYTLVSIILDVSTSVASYKAELEKSLRTVLESCKGSPRSENLMIRLTAFSHRLDELHGFRLLNDIKDNDYDGIVQVGGTTALFDAVFEGIEATNQYGKQLFDQDFLANAIIFIITDGEDNASTYAPVQVNTLVQDTMKEESLESITTILVGVDNDPSVNQALTYFKDNANLTQYVSLGEATPQKLAKLADFVSKSISSTSQALGSGSASQPLDF